MIDRERQKERERDRKRDRQTDRQTIKKRNIAIAGKAWSQR